MSADGLREAAALLRERAKDQPASRWFATREPGMGYIVEAGREWVCEVGDQEGDDHIADYIATMAPPVALALADWLTKYATLIDASRNLNRPAYGDLDEALAVAAAILGDRT